MLELVVGSCRGSQLFDMRAVAVRTCICTRLFESGESCVDALPPGAHELHEQREIVDTRMALGKQIALEPLEPTDRLVEEAADLGDVARDREHLGSQAIAYGDADLRRNRRLELRRCGGEVSI